MAFASIMDRIKGDQLDDTPMIVPDDLSELDEDLIPEDPKPSRTADKAVKTVKRVTTAVKITAAKKKEIKDFLILMITMPSGAIAMRDPHCGGAFLDNAENIADALVPLICRNPAMLNWFTSGAGMFDYFMLMQALTPVATTIYQHHVAKSIDHDHEEENHDYSQFTAPRFA